MPSTERWAAVREAPGYEVSTRGRLRCGDYLVATWPNHKGYVMASLVIAGTPRLRYVHRLVLEAFAGPARGAHANHRNGDKGVNALENLEWVSASDNARHAWRSGLRRRARDRRTGQQSLLELA